MLPKKVLQKAPEATGEFKGNKIAVTIEQQ